MNGDPHFAKTHPYLDLAGGAFAFGIGRALGLRPIFALAVAGGIWYFLP